jgi:hypothetical protein
MAAVEALSSTEVAEVRGADLGHVRRVVLFFSFVFLEANFLAVPLPFTPSLLLPPAPYVLASTPLRLAGSRSTPSPPSSRSTPSMRRSSSTLSGISTRCARLPFSPGRLAAHIVRSIRPSSSTVSFPFSSNTCLSPFLSFLRGPYSLSPSFSGGERSLIITLHGRPPHPHPRPIRWILPPMDASDPFTFLALKRGILRSYCFSPSSSCLC